MFKQIKLLVITILLAYIPANMAVKATIMDPVEFEFIWDWRIGAMPNEPDSQLQEWMFWGSTTMVFSEAQLLSAGLGTPDAPQIPPIGPAPTPIDIEIVSMQLTGIHPIGVDMELTLFNDQPIQGQVTGLNNSGLELTGNVSFFDVFFDIWIDLDDSHDKSAGDTILRPQDPFSMGMDFPGGSVPHFPSGVPTDDFFWMPVFNWWAVPPTGGFPIPLYMFDPITGAPIPTDPWDDMVFIHTEWTEMPEPDTLMLFVLCLAIISFAKRKQVVKARVKN